MPTKSHAINLSGVGLVLRAWQPYSVRLRKRPKSARYGTSCIQKGLRGEIQGPDKKIKALNVQILGLKVWNRGLDSRFYSSLQAQPHYPSVGPPRTPR